MNSNEVELRCYANGNVNKADEVLRGPSLFSISFYWIDLKNEKKKKKTLLFLLSYPPSLGLTPFTEWMWRLFNVGAEKRVRARMAPFMEELFNSQKSEFISYRCTSIFYQWQHKIKLVDMHLSLTIFFIVKNYLYSKHIMTDSNFN